MKKHIILFFSLFALLQSCIPSLHPLYTPETLAFEPALLGTWKDNEGVYTFKEGKGKSYILSYIEEGEEVAYRVHLVKLGDQYFFDFYTNKAADDIAMGLSIAGFVPTHTFAKVKWADNKLEIRHFAEGEWLEELFEQRRIRIKHEVIDNEIIVLTASPKELQQFFLKYADDPKAFTESSVWEKAL